MEAPAPPRPLDLEGRKILLVDDDRVSGGRLGDILRREGCVLAEAGSAEQTREVYATFLPDLVLLAARVLGSDGCEICRELRKTHGDPCAPIIFLTGANEAEDVVAQGLEAGGVDHLPTLAGAKTILARIRPHLRNRVLTEELKRAKAAKNQFLGRAAHDLRSPLGAIIGTAEYLRAGVVGPLTPDQLDLVGTIHTTSEQVLELVKELLDLAVIDSGELRLLLEPWNFSDLITESVALVNMEAGRKKIRVVFDAPSAVIEFRFDAVKIRQVVDNLLSNAVKYSPPGSTITVLMLPDVTAGTCAFCVRDQGVGIPAQEREKLFQDFGRLSVRPTGGENSTGLGLVICQKIVEAHHGTIVAENLPTRGCEFRVTLPTRR